MEHPKVSVVTITYGHEKYITDTLDGVLMQQYDGPVEFIIANDNSPDNTDQVVKKYFAAHPVPDNFEIKYTRHETNKGMMPNFIWALEQATGKYIALCEGDDYWTDPLKLQKQVDFLEKNQHYFACQHARKVLFESGDYKLENFHAHIFTQCILFRNDVDENYMNYIASYKIFNGDSFLEYYLKARGNYAYLDFVGAIYRSNGLGVFSSMSTIDKRENGFDSYQHIYRFIDNSSYKRKRYVLKIIKSKLADVYYSLLMINAPNYSKVNYISLYIKYRICNLIDLKRLVLVLFKRIDS